MERKYDVAHYGVDPKIFLDADPKLFRETTGIKGYILQAGRVEAGKSRCCWALEILIYR